MSELVDYAADLKQIAGLASDPQQLQQTLNNGLCALRGIIPYDLAVLYELRGNQLVVRSAEGPLANEKVKRHRLELERFPTIRRALATRRPIAVEEHQHASDEGDPYDGVLDLPHGHSCMVIPLSAGDRELGLITLDRTVCEAYSPSNVALADVYGQLVSTALLFAEQAQLLDRYRKQLEQQNRQLSEDGGASRAACSRIENAESPAMKRLTQLAKQVADSDVPVLIRGETGSGKEVLAQAIHAWSARAARPFVKVNCAAIPDNLVESELFGHVKGAFSGAHRDRPGRFLTANGGTLLLDEIGDMPLLTQAKLLRVLQEGMFEPVGADRTVRVDVRVIAASHVDLEQAIADGRFREDLYYRLAAFPLQLPPLRERQQDIASLAEGVLAELSRRYHRGPWQLTSAAKKLLEAHDWPGNVRELVNSLERATVLVPSGELDGAAFELGGTHTSKVPPADPAPVTGASFPSLKDVERQHLERALELTGGKIYGADGAAKLLELKPTTLQSKLKKHGLKG